MVSAAEIVETIFDAIEELNSDLFKDNPLKKNIDTVLLGKGTNIDSLGLVNLIVAIEQKIEDKFGILLTIVNERAMSQKNSPFRTVRSLFDYIAVLLTEKDDCQN